MCSSDLMDWIFIRELRLPAWIGLYKHEKAAQQVVEIDLEIAMPNDKPFRTGKVKDTIDYAVVVKQIKSVLESEKFGLVESMVERIANLVLEQFDSPKVVISITKLGILKEARRVGVRVERSR